MTGTVADILVEQGRSLDLKILDGDMLQFHTSRNHRTSAVWDLGEFIVIAASRTPRESGGVVCGRQGRPS
jgi:hypothetical protein